MKTLVCFLGTAGILGAAAIPIYSTGQAAPGSVDSNWTIVAPSEQQAFVTAEDGFPIGAFWAVNDSASRWIQPVSGTFEAAPELTTYTYQTTFTLAGFNPQTAVLIFRAMADNEVREVRLNGNVVGFTHTGFDAFSNPFSVDTDAWFNSGLNILEFDVFNSAGGASNNPTGFRLEISGTADEAAPTHNPEPSTLALVGAALAAAVVQRRRTGSLQ